MYIWFRIKQGDVSSLPYKTVRYVCQILWLSTNCPMPESASRFMRIRINPNRRGSECVRRTPDTFAATVQHVSIDHRRRHVFVTQQFLNRTDQSCPFLCCRVWRGLLTNYPIRSHHMRSEARLMRRPHQ
jgi:hypothetical protein